MDHQTKIETFRNIVQLAKGERTPKTIGHQQFMNVVNGSQKPSTEWEIIYSSWKAMGEPPVDEFFNSGKADDAIVAKALSNFTQTKSSKKKNVRSTKKALSAAAAKKLGRPKRSQAEIEKTHRKSGFYKEKNKSCARRKSEPSLASTGYQLNLAIHLSKTSMG